MTNRTEASCTTFPAAGAMTGKNSEISAIEAARTLDIGLDYLYGLIWTGKIVAHKVENRWRVSMASVEARLKEREARNGYAVEASMK
jgi:excisionase family DNA binding protein